MDIFDLVIIGGGPSGITAGIYAMRAKLNTILLEKESIGGQVAVTDIIENYPCFPSITGQGLSDLFRKHADAFNLLIKNGCVIEIVKDKHVYLVKTESNDYRCKSIIIASGARPKRLGVKGERELYGKGVSSCATCDGFFFREKEVAVVGGGDTAVKEALYLTKLVKRLYLIHRRDRLRAEKVLQERILASPKVEFLYDSVLEEIIGNKEGVTRVKVKHLKSNNIKEIRLDGVFIFIGIEPNNNFIDAQKDEWGFLVTNEKMETSLPGIFAAGDCRATPLRQIATAVGDAAIAAIEANEYISTLKGQGNPERS